MRSWVLRVVLASLLIATVAQRLWLAHVPAPSLSDALVELLVRNGFPARATKVDPSEPLGHSVSFQPPGCNSQGRIFVVDISLQDAPILDHIVDRTHTRRIAYLGRVWLVQDRMAMRLEWLKQRILSLGGAGQYAVNTMALVITEPRECKGTRGIDWSELWR